MEGSTSFLDEACIGSSLRTEAQRHQNKEYFQERAVSRLPCSLTLPQPGSSITPFSAVYQVFPSSATLHPLSSMAASDPVGVSSQRGIASHSKQITLLPRPPFGCALRSRVCSQSTLTSMLLSEHGSSILQKTKLRLPKVGPHREEESGENPHPALPPTRPVEPKSQL